MDAAEAKLQKVLEGSKQFLVPHYQRPYSWDAQQWQTLWRDIIELVCSDDGCPRFASRRTTAYTAPSPGFH